MERPSLGTLFMKKNQSDTQTTSARRGMTLIEIMVVVSILGLISGVVTLNLLEDGERNHVNSTKIQIESIKEALSDYRLKFGQFPSTEEGLETLVARNILEQLPQDGWKQPFVYVQHQGRLGYTLKSYGADGSEGGTRFDSDIVSEKDL